MGEQGGPHRSHQRPRGLTCRRLAVPANFRPRLSPCPHRLPSRRAVARRRRGAGTGRRPPAVVTPSCRSWRLSNSACPCARCQARWRRRHLQRPPLPPPLPPCLPPAPPSPRLPPRRSRTLTMPHPRDWHRGLHLAHPPRDTWHLCHHRRTGRRRRHPLLGPRLAQQHQRQPWETVGTRDAAPLAPVQGRRGHVGPRARRLAPEALPRCRPLAAMRCCMVPAQAAGRAQWAAGWRLARSAASPRAQMRRW
jgi:hypothetical protein